MIITPKSIAIKYCEGPNIENIRNIRKIFIGASGEKCKVNESPIQCMTRILHKLCQNEKLDIVANKIKNGHSVDEFAEDLQMLADQWQGPIRIWHLSDLHFGKAHHNLEETYNDIKLPMSETIVSLLKSLKVKERPDIIVVSGDISCQADVWQKYLKANNMPTKDWPDEMGPANKFLNEISKQLRSADEANYPGNHRLVVVPGNHDIAWIGDTYPLFSFREAIPEKYFVTPYTSIKLSDTENNIWIEAITRVDRNKVPVSIVRYKIRDIEIVFLLLVTDYYEGQFRAKPKVLEEKARNKVNQFRYEVLNNGWQNISERKFKNIIDSIDSFGNHNSMITIDYKDVVAVMLQEFLGNKDSYSKQIRICVSHAPLVYVQGVSGDITDRGKTLIESSAYNFHALMSGHLHTGLEGVKLLKDETWILSGGTPTANLDKNKITTQDVNSFGEISIRLHNEHLHADYMPWIWEFGSWILKEDRKTNIISAVQ